MDSILNALTLGAIYALIAVGYTMVYGIIKLINFAHGEVYMAGAMLAWWFTTQGVPLLLALPLAMLACAVLGVALDVIAYRPLRRSTRLAALITAIGMSLSLQTIAVLIFGARPHSFPTQVVPEFFNAKLFELGGAPVFGKELAIWIAAAVSMIALDLLVNHTRLGKAMRACSLDQETAALMGVDVNKVIGATFAIGSALAAVAGVLYALKIGGNIEPRMGYYPGLIAFAAAVLGGIGNIRGAMLGGLIIGGIQAIGARFLSTKYDFAYAFGVMIVVIIFRPHGLLGRPEAKRA